MAVGSGVTADSVCGFWAFCCVPFESADFFVFEVLSALDAVFESAEFFVSVVFSVPVVVFVPDFFSEPEDVFPFAESEVSLTFCSWTNGKVSAFLTIPYVIPPAPRDPARISAAILIPANLAAAPPAVLAVPAFAAAPAAFLSLPAVLAPFHLFLSFPDAPVLPQLFLLSPYPSVLLCGFLLFSEIPVSLQLFPLSPYASVRFQELPALPSAPVPP